MELLRVLNANPVSDAASYAAVALYGMIHKEPRSKEQVAHFVDGCFEDGHLLTEYNDLNCSLAANFLRHSDPLGPGALAGVTAGENVRTRHTD